jgi:crotonobetainyl-CoA:carnitine CoA-transferase CaiB-like acyl-CoA transferase
VSPVLSLAEAPGHPHNVARGTFVAPGGIRQAIPAPRFLSGAAPSGSEIGVRAAEAASLRPGYAIPIDEILQDWRANP